MSVYLLSMFRTSPCLGAGLEPGGFLPGSLGGSWAAACSGTSGGMAAFTAGRLKKLSYRVSTRGLYTVAGAAAPLAGAPALVRAAAEEGSLSNLAICTEHKHWVVREMHDDPAQLAEHICMVIIRQHTAPRWQCHFPAAWTRTIGQPWILVTLPAPNDKKTDFGRTARPTPLSSCGGIASIFKSSLASLAISDGDAMNLGSVTLLE